MVVRPKDIQDVADSRDDEGRSAGGLQTLEGSVQDTGQGNEIRDDILVELATLIAERQSLESVFRAFAERLLSGTAFDFATLAMLDATRHEYVTVAAYPEEEMAEDAPRSFRIEQMKPWALRRFRDGTEYEPQHAGIQAGTMLHAYGLRRAWTMPLLDEDAVLGILTVARYSREPFLPSEQAFLRKAARLLTSAVREETRVHEAQQEAARSQLISELSLLLNEEEPVASLFDRVHALLGEAIQTDFAMLGTTNGDNALHVIRASPPLSRQARHEISGFHHEWANLEAGLREFNLAEPGAGPAWGGPLRDLSMSTCLMAPLQQGGTNLGVLVLARSRAQPFTERDHRFIELVATLLSQAMAIERRYEASQRELEEQRVIAAIMSAAARESDPAGLLRAIQGPLGQIIPGPVAFFGFQEDDRVSFVLPDGSVSERQFSMVGDQVVYARLPGTLRDLPQIRRLGLRATAVSRAQAGGTTVGYLVIGSQDATAEFSAAQLELFRLVAQLIGPVLRHAQETAMGERERSLLRLAFGALSEGIVLVDRDLKPVYHNELGRLVIGLAGANGDVPDWSAALPPEVAIKLRTTALYNIATRGRTMVVSNGNERWLDFSFVPIEHPEYRLMCVIRDVSEEVALEQREEHHREEMERAARLAALGSLVGGVAHELNNPLTAILGFSELLADTLPAGQAADDLRVIKREAERAKHIVGDLLFIGRPAPVERREFSIGTVLGHIERVRQSTWIQANIDVRMELPEEEITAWGNEDRITQVALNLITNAEDAVANAEPAQIVVRVYEEDEHAVLEVRDNGSGMEEATRRHIFEPFFTTKQGTGTGLGLSVSYSIVQAHDGQLEVESVPGEGACFRVRLPRKASRQEPVRLPEPAEDERNLHILVIDDEPSLRKVCQRMVRALGHECSVADGVESAVALAQEQDFDLVLCDYRLTNASADEVIHAFETVNPALISRTVLATGAMNDEGVVALLERYQLKLLPKPYGADEIAALISELEPAA